MPGKTGDSNEAPLKAEMTIEVVSEALDRFIVALREITISLTAAPHHTLADYRTVIAARGLDDIQRRLDEGWELLHLDLCDEVRSVAGPSQRANAMMWVPYAILGKRAVLMAADQLAILRDEERQMRERASPLGSPIGMGEEVPAAEEPPFAEGGPVPEPPREKVQARVVTEPVASKGFTGQGALANR